MSVTVTHAPGEGNRLLYKAGCRCAECRADAARQQAERRARVKERKHAALIDAVAARIEAGGDHRNVVADVIALARGVKAPCVDCGYLIRTHPGRVTRCGDCAEYGPPRVDTAGGDA